MSYSIPHKQRVAPELVLIACGLLAVLSLSGGIIAIFGHNWDQFPHGLRMVLGMFPVLLGLAVFSYAFLKKKDSKVWMECSAAFLLLMLGSSLALITQLYHTSGSFKDYLFVWMLFSVPLVYIAHSTCTAVLYVIGITVWAMMVAFESVQGLSRLRFLFDNEILYYWALLAIAIPHFIKVSRPGQIGLRSIVLGWTIALCLWFGGFQATGTHHIMSIALLLTLLYAAGKHFYGGETHWWKRPFQTTALAGTLLYTLGLSAKGALQSALYIDSYQKSTPRYMEDAEAGSSLSLIFCVVVLVLIIWFYMREYRQGKVINYLQYLLPFIVFVALVMAREEWYHSGRILLNVYLLSWGGWFVYQGTKQQLPGVIGWGIAVLTATLAVRYFDSTISFYLKGLIYIGIGALVFLFNYIYSKRAKL